VEKSHNQVEDFPKEKVRSAIQQGITQAEAQIRKKEDNPFLYKKKKRRHKLLYIVTSVTAAFSILVCSSYYSPALASSLSQIPIIGSVFGDSNLVGLRQAQKKGLVNKIGETQTVNGISVTLDEVLYDQNNITIGLKINSERELGELYFGAGMDFTINGETPKSSSGGYGEEIQSPKSRTAIQDINVTEDMPNEFDLGLILHGERGETWYFSAPIKQITNIQKVPVRHLEHVEGIDLSVEELSLSETGIGIFYTSSEEGTDFEQSRAGNIEFHMVDQDGNEVKSHSGGVTGKLQKERNIFEGKKQFDPVDASVTELTITPYLELPTDGGGVEIDENGQEREVGFKKKSSQPIDFKSFKVKLP
jgi:hypothetical protein